jgi:hypothetical protein
MEAERSAAAFEARDCESPAASFPDTAGVWHRTRLAETRPLATSVNMRDTGGGVA